MDSLKFFSDVASKKNIVLPPLSPSVPRSPVGSIGVCGAISFSQETVARAARSNAIVDDVVVRSGATTQTALTLSQFLSGVHAWYVVALDSDVEVPGTADTDSCAPFCALTGLRTKSSFYA